MPKREIWSSNLFTLKRLIVINLNCEGCTEIIQQQLGIFGTAKAFACKTEEARKQV